MPVMILQGPTIHSVMSLLTATLLFGISAANFVLFPYMGSDVVDADNGFGNTSPISDSCAQALNGTVECETRLQYMVGSFTPWNDSATSSALCAQTCRSSLDNYHSTTESACGSVDAFDGLPVSWRGDQIRDYLNVMCAKDSASGEYCVDVRQQQLISHPGVALLDLPHDVLCSDCQIALWRAIQGSPYNGYDDNAAKTWTAVQLKCGTSYPTTVQTVNLTLPGVETNSTGTSCASGHTYTVKPGDTCHSIAVANSVSEGLIWAINNLKADCGLLAVGQELCLPNTCTTTTMSANDTCFGIALDAHVRYSAFLNWNPTIDSACSNLNPNGSVVCISSPYETWNNTAIPGTTPTKTAEYALSTSPAPAPTAHGTTLQCGSWYVCLPGDDCARISVQYSISVDLFNQLNPSVDELCDNLLPGLAYCVLPTVDWDAEANNPPPDNSTTVAPPAPTESGTTNQCYVWHVAQANETCELIAASFGISFQTLRFWNPSIDEDCYNFNEGEAYCVRGAVWPTETSVPTVTPTGSSPPSTSTSSSSTCSKTYTVVSGDYCSKIWTSFGLSEAQFRALNPSLNADCDLDIDQVLCVAGPGSGTTPTSSPPSSQPTTTSPPTTCGKTYTVVGGDYCYKIYDANGLTEEQFRALNPQLNENCDLDVGQVVCVAPPGAGTPTTTARPTTTTTTTTPGAGSCKKTYTVVGGDYCYKVYTDNGLTEAQFRALNPGLDADCALDVGQVLCVA